MITFLHNIRTSIDGVYPGLFNATIAGLVFVSLWLIRRFKPLLFAKMPPALQAWPALVSSAFLAAITASSGENVGQTIVNVLGQALAGLVSGVLAVGLHRTLKESPLPYGSSDIPPKKSQTPLVSIVFAAVALTGCASFLHWSPSALPDVAALCAFSGDVEAQLEALAKEYGVPVEFVRDAFSAACSETAKSAPDEAKHAGLSAARASVRAAAKSGARFDGGAK